MTKEEKCVVNPLETYFLDHKRSGAKWTIKHRPRYGTSATGWDLQVERKNQVLLIEAKYIQRSFASAFAGLVTAPLTKRKEKMKSGKKRSWSSVVCWAIGYGYKGDEKNIISKSKILLDYLARNLEFWKCYYKTLNVKYIFLVDDNQRVAKISFNKMITLAELYKLSSVQSSRERKSQEGNLLKTLKFK